MQNEIKISLKSFLLKIVFAWTDKVLMIIASSNLGLGSSAKTRALKIKKMTVPKYCRGNNCDAVKESTENTIMPKHNTQNNHFIT